MALSYVGSAVGTTSATLPSFLPGDIALTFAFRDGVATAPSLPAGWDDVISGAANTCAQRVGTRQLQTGDTSTGTWTNATSVIVHILRPTGGHAIVGASSQNGGTATSVTYPALTLQDASGSSWVVRMAGHRSVNTNLQNPPSGYTFRNGQVTATDELATFDSAAGLSANPTADAVAVGGTASGWRTVSIEVRFEPARIPPTYRSSTSNGDSSFTNNQITADVPGGAGVAIGSYEEIKVAAAWLAGSGAAPIINTPAGWNLPDNGTGLSVPSAGGLVNTRTTVFWRMSPDTGSPATLAISTGANGVFVYERSAYDGVDPTNPVRQVIQSSAGSGNSIVFPSFNAVVDSMLQAFVSLGAAQTTTPPASMTARQNNAAYGVTAADEVLTTTGLTGPRTFTFATTSEAVGAITEIRGVLAPTGVTGTLNAALGALTVAGAGTVEVSGTLSRTLGALTLSAAGAVPVSGSLTATLGGLGLAATGVVGSPAITGTLSATLGALTLASAGTAQVAGALTQTLGALGLAATGAVGVSGSLAATLGPLTLVAAATARVTGSLTATLGPLTLTAAGTLPVIGTLNATLGSLGLVASGVVGSSPVIGTLNATLGALTASGAGTVRVAGALAATLGPLGVSTAGTVRVSGTLARTLGPLGLAATGAVAVRGVLSATLGPLTLVAAATARVTGSLTATLGPLTLDATGTNQPGIVGSLDVLLGALTLVATGVTSQTKPSKARTIRVAAEDRTTRVAAQIRRVRVARETRTVKVTL